MNKRNSTLSALNALPASEQGLMDFYALQHLRCQPLETVHIQPSPEWTDQHPNIDIFTDPLQITVLGIHHSHVDLGLYAHPGLLVQQGPKPSRIWRRKWRKAPFLRYMRHHQESVGTQLLRLCDDFHRLQSLHHFCYQAIEELLHMDGMDYDARTLQGFIELRRWLAEQDQQFEAQLCQLQEHHRQFDEA